MIHQTGPSHVWKEPGLPPAMPIMYTQALHTLPWSIIGGFCVQATTAPKTKTTKVQHYQQCDRYGPKGSDYTPKILQRTRRGAILYIVRGEWCKKQATKEKEQI